MEPLPSPNKVYLMTLHVEKQQDIYASISDPTSAMFVRASMGCKGECGILGRRNHYSSPEGQTSIVKNIVTIVKWWGILRKPILNCMAILIGKRN